jgi:1-acyl-sn-glycerol-3-phosphate acyltransferase
VITAFHDAGHGYDVFGLDPRMVARVASAGRPIYERYFRVASRGAEQVPATGPAIVVANHSGMLPVDAAMLWLDLVRRTGRIPRMIADRFVPGLPFAGTLFARTGVVAGTRTNVRRLLELGELLVIFPEGVTGVAKPWRERYRLQDWRVGHAELAIRHRAPVVPAAIVGAEESWPVIARLKGIHAFGAPYFPIPASPFPLPVRYHIRYGRPIALHRDLAPNAADDPELVAMAAARIRAAVADLVAGARAERKELFR